MGRASLRLENGTLDFVAADIGLDERRRLDDGDVDRFAGWAKSYADLHDKDGAQDALLALGRELYGWLDGGERWLQRLAVDAVPPVVMEFQAPTLSPDDAQKAFLQVPWELLAGTDGFLSADKVRLFCPLRRLGKLAEPEEPDDLCLGLTFMAAAPRGASQLDYGGEENAIQQAAGGLALDLVVEESGNPDLLAEKLTELDGIHVLHLSCHGRGDPDPALMLEDEEGGMQETGPADLVTLLRTSLPRLAFLSACRTSAGGAAADPLSLTLVRAGMPATLGWDGSVYDHEAIAFAEGLYRALARRRNLEEAAAVARADLLTSDQGPSSQHWHLARLWLGPRGGGCLVGGKRRRWLLGADHGHKAFLDARRNQSPGQAARRSWAAGGNCRPASRCCARANRAAF